MASETCKHANEVMSKAGSEVILKALLNIEIDVDALPMGPESNDLGLVETICVAREVRPRGTVDVLDFESGKGRVVGRVGGDGVERGVGGEQVLIKEEPDDD